MLCSSQTLPLKILLDIIRSWVDKMASQWNAFFLEHERLCFRKKKKIIPEFSRSGRLAICVGESLNRQNYLSEVSWCRGTSILWTFTSRTSSLPLVLNGSCRQKRMPLCWNKWRGENGVKTTPLRCINLHMSVSLFITSLYFLLKKQSVLTFFNFL